MDNDFFNQSPDRGFLYFWGIEHFDGLMSEDVNVGEFWEGLGVDTDLGVGFLLFRGTWRLGLLSSRSGLCPSRGYSVRRCLLVFAYRRCSHGDNSDAYLFLTGLLDN